MKRICLVLISLICGYFCYPQVSFYYDKSGNKIYLYENQGKIAIGFKQGVDFQNIINTINALGEFDIDSNNLLITGKVFDNQIEKFHDICLLLSKEILFASPEYMSFYGNSTCSPTEKLFLQTDDLSSVVQYLTDQQIPYTEIEVLRQESREYVIHLPYGVNSIDVSNKIFENKLVRYSQPAFVRKDVFQNPYYSYQWNLNNPGLYCDTICVDINAEPAWTITKGDTNIITALLDNGSDHYHEDLENNILLGYNAVANCPNGQETADDIHGTMCAGIIIAEDNEVGIIGISPKGKLLPIRIGNHYYLYDYNIIRAFNYLLDSTNASIASCSWGNITQSEALINAISRFICYGRSGKGGVAVFSAGNFDTDTIIYPGSSIPDCIIVGAICPNGVRKMADPNNNNDWGSCFGRGLCVMAPGVQIPTTIRSLNNPNVEYIGEKYAYFEGTSAACPHVAGVAALVLSVNPNLSGRKVKEIIERSCTKVRQDIYDYDSIAPHGTWDYQMGYGLVNAYQAVLMAQGCKDYPYCTIDTIRGNVSWNTPITVGEDLVIDSLATLTVTDTVAFYSEARIIIRPGGTLIVNGGTLTSACDGEMWQGIIVEGDSTQRQTGSKQGAVYLTNATIENARNAISTRGAENNDGQWAKTGGIVQATNTLFRNNLCSAEFLDYENHKVNGNVTNNVSYFTRCTFTIDDDNLFAENNDYFLYHVALWKVRGVKFNGCDFRNETTTTSDSARGKAIYTEEAGFIAQRVCPMVSNLDPCGCLPSGNDPVTRCSFEGFFEAVHAANTLGNNNVTIDNCDFFHNRTSIFLSAADNARVSFCDFNLSGNYETSAGLLLNNSTGYTVESNTLYKQSFTKRPVAYGIMAGNSGTAENVIRKNEFTNLYYGCFAIGINASNSFFMVPGLQFLCNIFSGCSKDISVSDGTICFLQGISSAGADNEFQNTRISSFNLSNANNIIYSYSNTTTHIPYNPSTGVIQNDTATANACSSTLCGMQVNPKGTETALAQYRALEEELQALSDTFSHRGYREEELSDNAEAAALLAQISDLSVEMGDLSRTEIRAIVSDTVVNVALLKEWYRAIVETYAAVVEARCTTPLQDAQPSDIPVAAYQLAEVYSHEGDYAASNAVLSSLPERFNPDEASRNEYGNYLSLQRLRENVAGNWYRQTDTEIAELQQVAEYDNGRAARMAKEILCFFHHICYEDEPLLELDDAAIGERGLGRDAVHHVSTTTTTGNLTLHPNPAHNTLTVESASPIREITVYDMAGHAVMVRAVRANNDSPQRYDLNITSLHAGIYLLKVVTDNGIETAKFVKN